MGLKEGVLLHNGDYKIVRVLGQGGFGITYEAEQVALHRRVAIKEFFMKDYCERDETTSHVTLGTSSGSKEIVEKFRNKFVREAQMIASLDHPHIVKIHDVFEENGTAYYVMEYLGGGSLASLVKDSGPLSENQALDYVRQIGDALSYLHSKNWLHFDVKPSNILLNQTGKAVLIDFGISKHYDESGDQTSSTPVGISNGYAPLEQYQQVDISTFTPATDIYSLAATLLYLLIGQTPPQASVILESGLPATPGVSAGIRNAIVTAMQPRRGDRPQSISEFLGLLTNDNEEKEIDETVILCPKVKSSTNQRNDTDTKDNKNKHLWPWVIVAGLVVVFTLYGLLKPSLANISTADNTHIDTLLINGAYRCSTMIDAAKSQQALAFYKNFEDSIVLSMNIESDWCSIDIKQDSLIVSCMDNKTFETREQDIFFLKKNDSIVLASLSIQQNGAEKPTVPQWIEDSVSGNERGHDYVDLGLSVLWATCNVGAKQPWDYGGYYAYAETRVKKLKEYEYEGYKYRDTSFEKTFPHRFVKYDFANSHNESSILPEDDAAHVSWGGKWRMPSLSEQEELLNKCKHVHVIIDGHNGYKFTGPNGRSIFLPAAGVARGDIYDDVNWRGFYHARDAHFLRGNEMWLKSLFFEHYNEFTICADYTPFGYAYEYGRSIRPVMPK